MRFERGIELDLTIDKRTVYQPLPIEHVHQCMNEWCWAAVGSMFYNYHKLSNATLISLFDFVRLENPEMTQSSCRLIDIKYDDPLIPEKLFKHLNNQSIPTQYMGKTSKNDLAKALSTKPIIIGVGYRSTDGNGHFILLSGFDKEKETIYVNNPFHKSTVEMSWQNFLLTNFTTGVSSAFWSHTGFYLNNLP